jgi:hypothetical protein
VNIDNLPIAQALNPKALRVTPSVLVIVLQSHLKRPSNERGGLMALSSTRRSSQP